MSLRKEIYWTPPLPAETNISRQLILVFLALLTAEASLFPPLHLSLLGPRHAGLLAKKPSSLLLHLDAPVPGAPVLPEEPRLALHCLLQ